MKVLMDDCSLPLPQPFVLKNLCALGEFFTFEALKYPVFGFVVGIPEPKVDTGMYTGRPDLLKRDVAPW